MTDRIFSVLLTESAEVSEEQLEDIAEKWFAFDTEQEGFLHGTGGDLFIDWHYGNQPLDDVLTYAVSKIKQAGFDVKRIEFDPKQFEKQTEISRMTELAGA